MKKLGFSLAFTALAHTSFGQGSVLLDNSTVSNRVTIDVPGNSYSGTFGMEVWELNNTNSSIWGDMDTTASTNGLAAYAMLAANGFVLESTYVNKTMSQGVFSLDQISMLNVFPAGHPVTLALAAWDNSAASWVAATASGAKQGVIAFVQPTVDYSQLPPPAPAALSWSVNQDLVMLSSVPEPAAWALGLAGGAVILMLRRWTKY